MFQRMKSLTLLHNFTLLSLAIQQYGKQNIRSYQRRFISFFASQLSMPYLYCPLCLTVQLFFDSVNSNLSYNIPGISKIRNTIVYILTSQNIQW